MSSSTMTPTQQQTDIVDAVMGGDELVVQAGAGTGKSSTLRLASESLNRDGRRVLYLAFNKSVATDAQRSFPANVDASTSHALAHRQLRSTPEGAVLSKLGHDRIPLSRAAEGFRIRDLQISTNVAQRHLDRTQVAQIAAQTVRGFCASSDEQFTSKHVPAVPGIEDPLDPEARKQLVSIMLPIAQMMWRDITDPRGGFVQFRHEHYLKMWALRSPTLAHSNDSVLMLDEAQDTSEVLAGVVAAQTGMQRVLVGDSSQAIYGWAGAIDVMGNDRFAITKHLHLTQSWRFGQPIADAANVALDELQAPIRLSGNPAITSTLTPDLEFSTRDAAVLCRTNAGMIEEIVTQNAAGRRAHLRSNNKEHLLRFIDGAEQLRTRGRTSHPDLMVFTSWGDVQDYVDRDPSGDDLKTLVALVDRYDTSGLRAAVKATVSRADAADVTITTCHTAKGLEWDEVKISDDFAPAEGARMSNDALMLAYVSITRARRRLDPGELGEALGLFGGPPTMPLPAAASPAPPAPAVMTVAAVTAPQAPHTPTDQPNPTAKHGHPLTITLDTDLTARLTAHTTAHTTDPDRYVTRLLDAALPPRADS